VPKIKKGLEYFDIDTDVNSDMRVKLIRAEFGIKGFGIWIQLLVQIYGDEGYFMKWDKDTKLLFASDVGETGGLVDEVVNGLVKRGLFDKSVFDSFGVLTSKHIQEKYFNAIKRRESDLQVDARYLVISRDESIIKRNVNIKLLNVDRIKQSRVEQSKVNTPPPRGRPREEPEDGPKHKPDNLDELIEFFKKNHSTPELARSFYDHYDSQGWVKSNGMAITSWQSAASKWIREEKHNPPGWKQKSKSKRKGGGNGADRKSKGDEHVEALQSFYS